MSSSQADVKMDAAHGQPSLEDSADIYADYVPTFNTAIDRRGRRSIELRNDRTGTNTTYSDLFEGTMRGDPAMRAWFGRCDRYFCWISHDHIRPQILRTTLQVLSAPIFLILMGYNSLRYRWDVWKGR